MRYQGSKLKMQSPLRSIIELNISPDETYVEPFMGGCNSFGCIHHDKKIACDNNKYIVALWKDIQKGVFKAPEALTEEQYYDVKEDYLNGTGRYSDAFIGYVATACSFGSAWWNGYAKYNPKKNEDHIKEAYNGLQAQLKHFYGLSDCIFTACSYDELQIPEKAFIYCDPPYEATKKYAEDFDNKAFWDWCRHEVKKGHKVLVSEYDAPADFVCVWAKSMQDGMGNSSKKKVEKLFLHSSQVCDFSFTIDTTRKIA